MFTIQLMSVLTFVLLPFVPQGLGAQLTLCYIVLGRPVPLIFLSSRFVLSLPNSQAQYHIFRPSAITSANSTVSKALLLNIISASSF